VNTSDALKLAVVLLLCLPAVGGTVAMWALGADVLPDRVSNLVGRWSVELFLMAAYGPLLVVVASVPAILLRRQASDRRFVYAAWMTVSAGLLAAVAFWQLGGIDAAPTP
jgi:hypothetical protein